MLCFIAFTFLAPIDSAESAAREIPTLIGQLGDHAYARRQSATNRLFKIGEPALPPLRRSLDSRDPEIRFRAKVLIRAIMVAAGKSRTTGMTLSLIDPGKFLMGSPPRERGRRPDENQHYVAITAPFLMGRYEVTQEEYRQVMKREPSWFCKSGAGKVKVKSVDTSRYPVDNVSWFDAIAFCNALSELDGYPKYYRIADAKVDGHSIVSAKVSVLGGNGYRLPTEAEWEYACRAGSETPYHHGNGSNGRLANVKGISITNYGGRSIGPNLKRTNKVGSYSPNAFNLHDMHGNVAEWCWDWYARDYPVKLVSDPKGPKTGHHRVLRGGSWLVTESNARSASRLFHTPQERKYYTGFRVARTP